MHGVMTSLPWQTGLQSWQSCTIALAHSVGYQMTYQWQGFYVHDAIQHECLDKLGVRYPQDEGPYSQEQYKRRQEKIEKIG